MPPDKKDDEDAARYLLVSYSLAIFAYYLPTYQPDREHIFSLDKEDDEEGVGFLGATVA